MSRVIYRVALDGDNWVVSRDAVRQAEYPTKQLAVTMGSSSARREWELFKRPSQCIVNQASGSYEIDWLYGDEPAPKPS